MMGPRVDLELDRLLGCPSTEKNVNPEGVILKAVLKPPTVSGIREYGKDTS